MRVAITRAEPGASQTAQRLIALGATPLKAPLLSIVPTGAAIETDGVQAALFTSANAVRAVATESALTALPALCVGDATAEAARAAGFQRVVSADGDAAALAALAKRDLDPARGAVLHLSGENLAADTVAALRAAGFSARALPVYRAEAAQRLPEPLQEALAQRALDAVLFHSPRAARVFAKLALDAPTETILAACLSPAVAQAAQGLAWRAVRVAAAPREDALLRALLDGSAPPLERPPAEP